MNITPILYFIYVHSLAVTLNLSSPTACMVVQVHPYDVSDENIALLFSNQLKLRALPDSALVKIAYHNMHGLPRAMPGAVQDPAKKKRQEAKVHIFCLFLRFRASARCHAMHFETMMQLAGH